ncbi:MAG TPA: hypothetical protein VMQ40_03765 [Acidimicrobiales bacterium]|nr:hypothetical protein [Acidimicrobiales bacterium]
MRPPTQPSRAVVLDVGAHAGALILSSTPQREGLEVEIHPEAAPDRRRHVWVLPRQGREGSTVYAAVFPSLAPGRYAVLEPDGTVRCTVAVPANRVTYADWGAVEVPYSVDQASRVVTRRQSVSACTKRSEPCS